jgi:hypothetical protein
MGCRKRQALQCYLRDAAPSKEWIQDALRYIYVKAEESKDLSRMESVAMNLAKLGQHLVDRVELTEKIDYEPSNLAEELRKRAIIN